MSARLQADEGHWGVDQPVARGHTWIWPSQVVRPWPVASTVIQVGSDGIAIRNEATAVGGEGQGSVPTYPDRKMGTKARPEAPVVSPAARATDPVAPGG